MVRSVVGSGFGKPSGSGAETPRHGAGFPRQNGQLNMVN